MNKLSLRSKIIVALTLIPFVSLGAFLFVTFLSFKSDRLAYIYESSLSQSRLLNKYATESLSSIVMMMDQWLSLYKKESAISEDFLKQYLNSSQLVENVKGTLIIEFDITTSKKIKIMDIFKNRSPQDIENTTKDIIKHIQRVQHQGKHIFAPTNDVDFWTMISVFPKNENTRIVSYITFRNPWSRAKFPGQIVTDNIWVNDEGKILGQETKLEKSSVQSVLKTVLGTKASSGTFMFSNKGEKYIASFSFSNQFALLPINMIKANAAYEAVYIILEKSLMLLVILVILAILTGVAVASKLTSALEDLLKLTITIGKGQFNLKSRISSGDEFEVLYNGFRTMATQIKKLVDENKEVGRMEAELQLAKTVQSELLPPVEHQTAGIDLTGYTVAASECSGDWWNYFETDEDIYIFLGDATGHGASAALFTSAINSLTILLKNLNFTTPSELLNHMNAALYQTSKGKKSITISLLKINKKTGKLVYSNASHEFPYLVRNLNENTKFNNIECLVSEKSQPLGFLPDSSYKDYEFQLAENDFIVLYTDGISEAVDKNKKQWGERKFVNSMIDCLRNGYNSREIVQRFVTKFEAHTKEAPLADDATIVIINFKKANEEILAA